MLLHLCEFRYNLHQPDSKDRECHSSVMLRLETPLSLDIEEIIVASMMKKLRETGKEDLIGEALREDKGFI